MIALGTGREKSQKLLKAFSLLVHTEQPIPTRLFTKKSRTSPHSPVQSRSENALVPVRYQVFDAEIEPGFERPLLHELDQYVGLDVDWLPSLEGVQIGTRIGVRNDGNATPRRPPPYPVPIGQWSG